jgi:hypothetical protein
MYTPQMPDFPYLDDQLSHYALVEGEFIANTPPLIESRKVGRAEVNSVCPICDREWMPERGHSNTSRLTPFSEQTSGGAVWEQSTCSSVSRSSKPALTVANPKSKIENRYE